MHGEKIALKWFEEGNEFFVQIRCNTGKRWSKRQKEHAIAWVAAGDAICMSICAYDENKDLVFKMLKAIRAVTVEVINQCENERD